MRKIIFLGIAMLATVGLYSQVKKSDKTVEFQGKKYYMHKVASGQTMHAISKAYGISISNLMQNNYKTTSDLKAGEILKIPYSEKVAVVQSVKYKHYIVKKGDTLYSLARKFNTTKEELIDLNAGVEVALIEGRRLIVPVVAEGQPRYDADYYYHIVQDKETLSSIGRRYGVRVSQLKKINPKLNPKRMRKGDEVRIPLENARTEVAEIRIINKKTKGQKEVFVSKDVSEKAKGTLTQVPDSWVNTPYETNSDDWLDEGRNSDLGSQEYSPEFRAEYKAALLLPLTNSHSRMLNYYRGVLLAMEENKDVPLEVDIYDTGRNSQKVRRVLSKEKNLDFIIGPYTATAFNTALPYAKNQTMLLSLLSKNDAVYTNPNVLQFNTTEKTINHKIAKYIIDEHLVDNVILFDGNSLRKYGFAGKIPLEKIDNLEDKITRIQKYERAVVKDYREEAEAVLDKNKNNVVFVPISDYKAIGQVLNTLNAYRGKYDLKVIGYYKWKLLPNIAPDLLFNLNVLYFTPFHYLASEQTPFVEAYKTKFSSLPDDFSFIGYQTMAKFLKGLKNGGLYFYKKPLQKIFKHRGGGYEGINLYKVQYDKDYTITVN